MKQTTRQTNIAIFPSPGISHLIPLVEFAKRLVVLRDHNFHVTFFVPSAETSPRNATESVLETLPKASAEAVFLPPVSSDDVETALQIVLTVSRSLPSLRTALESEKRFAAFFADFFGVDALAVGKELGIPSYLFCASNVTTVSLFLRLPELDRTAGSIRFMRDLPEPVKLPGCPPLKGGDLFEPVQDRTSKIYETLVQLSKRLGSSGVADGFVINSFEDLEPEAIKALQEDNRVVYPVGPVIQSPGSKVSQNDKDLECLTWLDNQPRGSVLYVSFGSGGTLSQDQIAELALGLEMSGQRFVWVLRRPNDESRSAAYLQNGQGQSDPDACDFLPSGFLERTAGRGLVVPNWAPQAQVLAHGSTGGFLSHCGWGSTLESVACGVPMIAWPLFAEQHMNAVMLVEGLGVALRPKAPDEAQASRLVRREDVASVVRALMDEAGEEGKVVRERMKGLKDAAHKAVGQDGTSTKALYELASKLKIIN